MEDQSSLVACRIYGVLLLLLHSILMADAGHDFGKCTNRSKRLKEWATPRQSSHPVSVEPHRNLGVGFRCRELPEKMYHYPKHQSIENIVLDTVW